MVQMWSLEQPVREVGNRSFDDFEHTSLGDFRSVRRDQVVLLSLHLEIVAEGTLQANVVEGCHFVAIGDFSSVQDGPFCQLGDTVAALLILLVLLNAHLSIALKREEIAFCSLQAD